MIMAIRIDGYFDHNFGDDYMIKTVVEHFPNVDFVVNGNDGLSGMIEQLASVRISDEKTEKTLHITGSGFMINSFRAFVTELVWLIKGKQEPDWCIGCSIEPFKNKLYELVIRKKLEKYKLISCRDKYSYEWLKKNCKKVQIEYFPDILFAADIKKTDNKGEKLGVSVMNLGFDKHYESYYKALAEAADYYIDNTGKGVLLLAFDAGRENDNEACEYVRSLMKNKAVTIVVHGSENEIINAYSQCCKIIGTRFHSAVLALKMELGLYGIIYRHKMQALLDDIDFDGGRCFVSDMDIEGMKKFLCDKGEGYVPKEEYIKKAKGHIEILKKIFVQDEV